MDEEQKRNILTWATAHYSTLTSRDFADGEYWCAYDSDWDVLLNRNLRTRATDVVIYKSFKNTSTSKPNHYHIGVIENGTARYIG